MSKNLEERVERLEDVIVSLSKILDELTDMIELLSNENDTIKELIKLKSSDELKEIKKKIKNNNLYI